ncbi:hypothetical protein ABH926_007365 [Catenulispora sp. GP43]
MRGEVLIHPPGDRPAVNLCSTRRRARIPGMTCRDAIWDPPWAGSHYGYGRDFYTGYVASVAAPASAW